MRKTLLLTMLVGFIAGLTNAQEGTKFTSKEKKYNDWAIGVYGGTSILQGSDLNSFNGGESNFGYDASIVITKQINHAFGLSLQANMGNTEQSNLGFGWRGETEYRSYSLVGDLNFSNLLRRIDNRSSYRWALHGYAGIGLLDYEATLASNRGRADGSFTEFRVTQDQSPDLGSFFGQFGAGLRYNLSKSFDVELKAMYIYTGDEEFDGSGDPFDPIFGTSPEFAVSHPTEVFPANLEEGRDDAMITASIGLRYKIGKHEKHLAWVDPMQELYKRIPQQVDTSQFALKGDVCQSGDQDGDTICDDRDLELDTPPGVPTDGQGRSPDLDKDGIPDHKDDCPGVAGKPEDNGCPKYDGPVGQVIIDLSDILFDYNAATWQPQYNAILNKALKAMNSNPDAKFVIEGHTDARGSASYNQRLSQRRADAIKDYFTKSGIAASRMTALGKGETEIVNECTNNVQCSDAKHQENRRVLLFSDRQLTLE